MSAPSTPSDVSGKVVLVSGGGTGIGAATAARFASDGARVVVMGRRREPLDEVAARTGALAVVVDVSDAASVRTALDTVMGAYGAIDVVVANAGGHGFSSVEQTDDAAWAQSLQSNLTSAFVLCREALPELRRSQGCIVVVSSLAGLFAGPEVAGYTVAKHALIGLTRSLARDYGPLGVRANAVCPGWVRTPMADAEMDELAEHLGAADRAGAYARVTENVPLRRAAEPEEIASVVRFLGSAQSSYITGAVIVADGGAHVVDLPTIGFG